MQRLIAPRALAWAAMIATASLGLDACRTLPVYPISSWPEQRATLQAMERYQFRGQLAAATATEGFSAALSWQQAGVTSDAQLRAPFGVGGARLQYDGTQLQMTASNGVALAGTVAREAMINLLGFEPPLASLRYWLLGVPDPAAPGVEVLNDAQHLQRLTQSEWQIDYSDYAQQGRQWLPGLITLRRDDAKLKVHISHWQLP